MSLPTPTADAVASDLAEDPALDYRSVHTFAVLGLLLGMLSVVVTFTAGSSFESTVMLAPIPIAGLIVSLMSLRAINAASDLYTGKPLAQLGAALSALFLAFGLGYGGYVYRTEVPEGYTRTSFLEMKPSEQNMVNRELIPEAIQEFLESGEPVFIKGYIRPGSITFQQNLKEFLLVRDSNECCFGDISKVKFFDQVQVRLGTGLTTDFNRGIFRLGGVLSVGPGDPQAQTPLTYKLDATYVNP